VTQRVGVDACIAQLSAEAVAFRKALRAKLLAGLRILVEEGKRKIGETGIQTRTGALERGIVGRVVKGRETGELRGLVRPRKVNLGMWVKTRKTRTGVPFYWYFLEFGTGKEFSGRRSARSRAWGKKGKGGIRGRHFLALAAAAKRDAVIDVIGQAYDVFA